MGSFHLLWSPGRYYRHVECSVLLLDTGLWWLPGGEHYRTNVDSAKLMGCYPSQGIPAWLCTVALAWHYSPIGSAWGTETFEFILICGVKSIWISNHDEDGDSGDDCEGWCISQRESVRRRQEPICHSCKHRQGFLSSLIFWPGAAKQLLICQETTQRGFEWSWKLQLAFFFVWTWSWDG